MEHITGSQWWTRYQPVSYTLTSRSGNEAAFTDMVTRCNKQNVTIVVDAVINHMAAGSGTGVAGSTFTNRKFPYYSQNDFHHDSSSTATNCQVNNYNDKYNVQYCDLSGLPDLLTSSTYVQSQIIGYLKHLYSLGVRGLRVDAAKHQDAAELGAILKQLPSDMYIGQEVIGATGEAVQPSMYYGNGQVSEFYYSDYLCANTKNTNKMTYLQTFGESWGLMPDKYAVAFIDNHDTQRNGRAQLTYKDGAIYTLTNAFMLAWNYGTVRLMSSYYFTNTDQGPPSVGVNDGANCNDGKNWVCEHRYTALGNMVAWRNAAGSAAVTNWQNGDNTNRVAFSRGSNAFIAFNRDPSNSWTATLTTGLASGTYCNVIVGDTCSSTVVVDGNGKATVTIPSMSMVAIHKLAKK
jgi:alpha-amylase